MGPGPGARDRRPGPHRAGQLDDPPHHSAAIPPQRHRVSHTHHRPVGEIVHADRAITPDTPLRLSRALGTSDRFWLNLQTRYDIEVAWSRTRPSSIASSRSSPHSRRRQHGVCRPHGPTRRGGHLSPVATEWQRLVADRGDRR
ncbi:MAG TPA: HigA family addiction module antitoxin [Leifsonia sp.]